MEMYSSTCNKKQKAELCRDMITGVIMTDNKDVGSCVPVI